MIRSLSHKVSLVISLICAAGFSVGTTPSNSEVVKSPTEVTFLDRSLSETQNYYAMAAIKLDGSVIAWGKSGAGGDIPVLLRERLSGSVKASKIYSSGTGFAVLREDGSVVSWGEQGTIDPLSNTKLDGTVKVLGIASSNHAFAAIREDGSVVVWGSSVPSDYIKNELNGAVNVSEIFVTAEGFLAVREDGSLVTWGWLGEKVIRFSDSQRPVRFFPSQLEVVIMLSDGSAVSVSPHNDQPQPISELSDINTYIKSIHPNNEAYIAVLGDGTAKVWGRSDYGGAPDVSVLNQLVDVVSVVPSVTGFAALRKDGKVVSWGEYPWVTRVVAFPSVGIDDIVQVVSNWQAFAALSSSGRVYAWGGAGYGGDIGDFQISGTVANWLSSRKIIKLFSNSVGFAALSEDGSVISWGGNEAPNFVDGNGYIGYLESSFSKIRSLVSSADGKKVTDIIDNYASFVAIRSDGSAVNWGAADYTNKNAAAPQLPILSIASFANYRSDDSILYVGSAESDNIDMSAAGGTAIGLAGNDYILGSNSVDTGVGGMGNDDIAGREGNDHLIGNEGADKLMGGEDDDLINGGPGGDLIDGGGGNDTATYVTSLTGITANLEGAPVASTNGLRNIHAVKASDAAGDVYSNIENLIGSAHTDTLVGNKLRNTLTGGKSGDVLDGRGGIDVAGYSNSETSVVASLANPNENKGDAQGDTYVSIEGLEGSMYADTLIGNSFANQISGGLGNDSIKGLAGKDLLMGNAGADRIDCGLDVEADTVKYLSISDSPIGANRDQIINFKNANDKIDVSQIDANKKIKGNQAFKFSNAKPQANSLWFARKGKDIILRGDVDGNTKADFEILIKNTTTIRSTNFVL